MFTQSIKLSFYLLCIVCMVPCYGKDQDEASYQYLKNLTIEELIEVEVTLDDVFDVFDGLIKAKKVIVATGIEQSTARAPAVTTVITSQDIEAIGATDLDEVLETVPGLHVSRSANLYRSIYTIRGIFSENNPEILMLINGIPLTSLFAGDRSVAWGGMPIHMISRIEIIRGPGSAIYGADAYSGVINIITKNKDDIPGTEIGTKIGSFDTYESWVLHRNGWSGFDIVTSLEYRTTNGQDSIITADAQTQDDKVFKTHASFAPGPVNTGRDMIDARLDVKKGSWQVRTGYQGRNHLGTGAGASRALDPIGKTKGERTNTDLTYHNSTLIPYWDITTQLSYLGISFDSIYVAFPPGTKGGSYPDGMRVDNGTTERHGRLDTSAFYSGLPQHLIRIGVGYNHNHQYRAIYNTNFGVDATGKPLPPGGPMISLTGTPYAFNREAKRRNQYLFLQDTWTMTNEWELTTGIRYDDYSDFGKTINPRLALVWQPQPNFTNKLLYGRAFRAPAFIEMYNTNNLTALGNPNLKPEIINTLELAFDYHAKENLHLATNLFHYRSTEKIQFSAVPGAKAFMAQNVGTLEGNGVELEVRWKMNTQSSLLANYSYAKVTDKITNYDAGKYPRHSAYLRTDWLLVPNWYLDVQAKWIADRQRTLGDPRSQIADHTTIDFTLRYKDIREGRTNFALSVRNLFDTDAREPSQGPNSSGIVTIPNDLPLAGRSWFVELRYQF